MQPDALKRRMFNFECLMLNASIKEVLQTSLLSAN